MQSMKIFANWVLLTLVFSAYLYGFALGVTFEPCSDTRKNEPCNMTCQVPDFSQTININCNGSTRGSCTILGCTSNTHRVGGTTVYFEISSLSYSNDYCEWSCTYGTSSSSSSTLTVVSGILRPNLTGQANADGVKLTAIADCLYPYNPTVDVVYSFQDAEPYVFLNAQVDLQISTTPGGCSNAIERRVTAVSDVSANHEVLAGKSVFFKMKFSQYQYGPVVVTDPAGPYSFKGLTTPSSTISSDMSTTVSEPLSTISSDMPTTVSEVPPLSVSSSSEVPPPPVTTSSAGLSQEIVITIIISSILAVGMLILLIVLVVKQCRQKNRETPAKNKESRFATKQGNFTKKDASKSSIEPRKSKFSGKRNTKQESILLDKFKHTQLNNSEAPKDRMCEHYPQTTDYNYLNNSGNQHVFNHSHAERSMMLYGNQHDRYPKSHSGPNNRMLYQSCYPEHPRQNEEMSQYYRANNLYRGQQMYQRPYVAQYDHHIKNKPENKRSFEGRTYERNWDFLY